MPGIAPKEQANIGFPSCRAEIDLTVGIGNATVKTARHRHAVGHRRAGHLHRLAEDHANPATSQGKAAAKACRAGQDWRCIHKKAWLIRKFNFRDRTAKLGEDTAPAPPGWPIKIDHSVGGHAGRHRAKKAIKPVAKEGAFYQRDRGWHPPACTPPYKTSVTRSPTKALISVDSTLSEIAGPVFNQNMLGELDNDMILNFAQPGEMAIGQRIIVYGKVMDENGKPVPNTLVEVWQANAGGRYRHKKEGYLAPLDPNFGGVGRTVTDADGWYRFRTIRPGPYPWPNDVNSWRPAHIHVSVMGPSISTRLITQLYFEGDPLIPMCPIVNTLDDPEAVDTLVARLDKAGSRPMDSLAYRFDIVLRGRRQTHFENRPEGA